MVRKSFNSLASIAVYMVPNRAIYMGKVNHIFFFHLIHNSKVSCVWIRFFLSIDLFIISYWSKLSLVNIMLNLKSRYMLLFSDSIVAGDIYAESSDHCITVSTSYLIVCTDRCHYQNHRKESVQEKSTRCKCLQLAECRVISGTAVYMVKM